jgi:hypothetical protein
VEWFPVSDYAITNRRHHVAKLYVRGEPGYLLWLDGVLVARCFATSREAREWAAEHEKRDSGPSPLGACLLAARKERGAVDRTLSEASRGAIPFVVSPGGVGAEALARARGPGFGGPSDTRDDSRCSRSPNHRLGLGGVFADEALRKQRNQGGELGAGYDVGASV